MSRSKLRREYEDTVGMRSDDAFEPSEAEQVESEKEYEVYRKAEARAKMILIQKFGAANKDLNVYMAEIDHGGSADWSDYAGMSAEEIEEDFLLYMQYKG